MLASRLTAEITGRIGAECDPDQILGGSGNQGYGPDHYGFAQGEKPSQVGRIRDCRGGIAAQQVKESLS